MKIRGHLDAGSDLELVSRKYFDAAGVESREILLSKAGGGETRSGKTTSKRTVRTTVEKRFSIETNA